MKRGHCGFMHKLATTSFSFKEVIIVQRRQIFKRGEKKTLVQKFPSMHTYKITDKTKATPLMMRNCQKKKCSKTHFINILCIVPEIHPDLWMSLNSLSVPMPKPHSFTFSSTFSLFLWIPPLMATHKAPHSKALLIQPQQSLEAPLHTPRCPWLECEIEGLREAHCFFLSDEELLEGFLWHPLHYLLTNWWWDLVWEKIFFLNFWLAVIFIFTKLKTLKWRILVVSHSNVNHRFLYCGH